MASPKELGTILAGHALEAAIDRRLQQQTAEQLAAQERTAEFINRAGEALTRFGRFKSSREIEEAVKEADTCANLAQRCKTPVETMIYDPATAQLPAVYADPPFDDANSRLITPVSWYTDTHDHYFGMVLVEEKIGGVTIAVSIREIASNFQYDYDVGGGNVVALIQHNGIVDRNQEPASHRLVNQVDSLLAHHMRQLIEKYPETEHVVAPMPYTLTQIPDAVLPLFSEE